MHAWEAIQKTLDHIEANLAETIEIDELAKVAALSPFIHAISQILSQRVYQVTPFGCSSHLFTRTATANH